MATEPETHKSLIDLLKQQNVNGVAKFYTVYRSLIRSFALRAGVAEADADEVADKVIESVIEKIGTYNSEKATFRAWLFTITRNKVRDVLRNTKIRHIETALGGAAVIRDEKEATLRRHWKKESAEYFERLVLERVKNRVSQQQFIIYDSYVLNKWPVEEVARRLGINNNIVYLAGSRVQDVYDEVACQVREETGLDI